MIKIFFDTEFSSLVASDVYLISAGFISEDGKHEFYEEINSIPLHECSQFVKDVVIPLLDAPESKRVSLALFGAHLVEWLNSFDEPVTLVTDYAGDWLLVREAIGDLYSELKHSVKGMAVYCGANTVDVEEHFWSRYENQGKQHHAMYDARCLRECWLADTP